MGKINEESVAKIEEEPNEEMLLVSTIKSQTAEKKGQRDFEE